MVLYTVLSPTTATKRKSDFKLTTDTPYLALPGELWGAYYENLEENWQLYNGTALYLEENRPWYNDTALHYMSSFRHMGWE